MCKVLEDTWAEGRAEGRMESARETALKMLKRGYPLDEIIEISGLSAKEIRKLEEKLSA